VPSTTPVRWVLHASLDCSSPTSRQAGSRPRCSRCARCSPGDACRWPKVCCGWGQMGAAPPPPPTHTHPLPVGKSHFAACCCLFLAGNVHRDVFFECNRTTGRQAKHAYTHTRIVASVYWQCLLAMFTGNACRWRRVCCGCGQMRAVQHRQGSPPHLSLSNGAARTGHCW
jgi:hypothetical protein